LALTDIQVRDFALEQLQLQNTELKRSLDQVLNSSSETVSLHVSLLEQHLHLIARLNVSISAVDQLSTCQAQLLASDTQSRQTDAQLQALQVKHDKLAAQVSREDPILQSFLDHACPITYGYSHTSRSNWHLADKLFTVPSPSSVQV
jgi:hypothetical protein